ncbi:MAG: hypothetical protein ACTHLE_15245 [Agriterribacter sp.]
MNLLLDSRLPVDILMDHQLPGRLLRYPMLVVPEWPHIDPSIRVQLTEYVNNGGKLLIIGAEAVTDFKNQLGISIVDSIQKKTNLFAGFNDRIVVMHTDYQPVKVSTNAIQKGVRLKADDWRFKTDECLASIHPYGKGQFAGIYMNMGGFYNSNQNALSKELVSAVIKEMVPSFISTVEGSSNIHQVLTRKNGRMYVHLINTNGPHNNPNVLVYEEVTPVKDLKVSLRLQKKPSKVVLQPGNKAVASSFENGLLRLTIPEVKIYEIVEIEE